MVTWKAVLFLTSQAVLLREGFLILRGGKGELISEQRCPKQSVKVQLLGHSNRGKGHHTYDSYAELQDFK